MNSVNSSINSASWHIASDFFGEQTNDQWDHCPQILPDEIFLSWFTRLAKSNCANTVLLFQELMELQWHDKTSVVDKFTELELNITLKLQLIRQIKQYLTDQGETSLSSFQISYNNLQSYKRSKLFESDEKGVWNYLNIPLKEPRYCPLCLKLDEEPYFRQSWYLKFITVCQEHNCLLFDNCEFCGASIRYWKTDWNQPVTVCYNCNTSLIEDLCFTPRVNQTKKLHFQEDLIEVYYNRLFHGREVDPNSFFQQLWKLMCIETSEQRLTLNLNPDSSISTIRMFRALSLTMDILNSDHERLERPYFCKKDNMIFKTETDLISHQQDNCSQKNDQTFLTPNLLEIAETRFRIIQPLLELQGRTKKDVQEITGNRGISTIYHWIGLYERGGIHGLAPKHHLRGRKRGFSSDVERMILDIAKEGMPKNSSIKAEWKKFHLACRELGFIKSDIPSYESFRRRIKEVWIKN